MQISFGLRRSLGRVLDRMESAAQRRTDGGAVPRLVAVSKKKSIEHIIGAYNLGQRHFGENYVPELMEKARDPRVQTEGRDILWHYIGTLRRKQCKTISALPNLWMVETVGSEAVAAALDSAWRNQKHGLKRDLRVMVQVNTSTEESKAGCDIESCQTIVQHILKNCDHLKFSGLMAIGALENSLRCQQDPNFHNPDFEVLCELKEKLCHEYDLSKDQIDLSMGMTADMESAILSGSTNIRVGTAIFGSREDSIYSNNVEAGPAVLSV